jgi:chromate transporter
MIIFRLFLTFFKIGAFSFGGGYAMLTMIQEEVVQINQWLELDEFVDIVAVAEMTPGPIAINCATFLGYKVGGFWGAVLGTFGVILPSFIVVMILSTVFLKFQKSKYVQNAFKGIRPASIGLIAVAAYTFRAKAVVDVKTLIIAVLVFVLSYFKKVNPMYLILISGALGILMM